MTRSLFEITYELTKLNGGFMQTSTRVVAISEESAVYKLEQWLKTQKRKYNDISFLDIQREWCEIVV